MSDDKAPVPQSKDAENLAKAIAAAARIVAADRTAQAMLASQRRNKK